MWLTGEFMNISSLNNASVNNSPVGNNLPSQINNTNTATQGDAGKAAEIVRQDSHSVQDKRQAALQIVNRTLTAAYEKIASRGQAASAEYENFAPLTAEKVANNILGFIERRLQMDVAEGASPEALQARLEAGLAGFKKGFAEAAEKLEALSLLSPEIKTDIGKTYDLVLEGIDALRSKFIQTTQPTVDNSKSSRVAPEIVKTSDSAKAPTKLEVHTFIPASSSHVGYGNYEYGRAREFSFELTTKEGDKITIKASSSEGLALEAGRGSAKGSYSSSQSFSLSIEGELNEAELSAINDLLGRVNDLAGQFFAGNLDTAFAQAMNMGYEADQIAGFSLNLAQAEIKQVTQAYQAFEPNRGGGTNAPKLLNDQLVPLGNFIKDLLASVERASEFNEPRSLLSNMAEKVTGETEVDQAQGKRFRDFVEEILALELR
jgi:hypothetical protein